MGKWQETLDTVQKLARGKEIEQFRIDSADFLSARERGEAPGTRIEQRSATLEDSAEIVNRSFPQRDANTGQYTNVISPVVIPKDHRSYLWAAIVLGLVVLGLTGAGLTAVLGGLPGLGNLSTILFGPHYWLVVAGYTAFNLWRNSFVKVPDGCQALITRFGKLEEIAGPGRKTLLNPWKRVSYIINTTRE